MPVLHSSSEMWDNRYGIKDGHWYETSLAVYDWTFAPCLNKKSARFLISDSVTPCSLLGDLGRRLKQSYKRLSRYSRCRDQENISSGNSNSKLSLLLVVQAATST